MRQGHTVLHTGDAVFRDTVAAFEEMLDKRIGFPNFVEYPVPAPVLSLIPQQPCPVCISSRVEFLFPIMDEQSIIEIEEHHTNF